MHHKTLTYQMSKLGLNPQIARAYIRLDPLISQVSKHTGDVYTKLAPHNWESEKASVRCLPCFLSLHPCLCRFLLAQLFVRILERGPMIYYHSISSCLEDIPCSIRNKEVPLKSDFEKSIPLLVPVKNSSTLT